jgi:hypothetical protein
MKRVKSTLNSIRVFCSRITVGDGQQAKASNAAIKLHYSPNSQRLVKQLMVPKWNVDPKNYTNQFTKSNQKTFGENF